MRLAQSPGMRRLLPPLVMLTMAALITACPERPTKDPSNPGGADGGECPVCECEQPATSDTGAPGTPPAPEPK